MSRKLLLGVGLGWLVLALLLAPTLAQQHSGVPELRFVPLTTQLGGTVTAIVQVAEGRLFVATQNGVIHLLDATTTLPPQPFLSLTEKLQQGGEQGLLGLAFHPAFEQNGYFFVNYTNVEGDTVVARYRVSATNPNSADPLSEQIVLTINQPYQNHNSGVIGFGPDGYLYIATGDGGGGGDPDETSQNQTSLLGKLLRIDVNSLPYTIPLTNPFVGQTGWRGEIWALGLRNPWQFDFDPLTKGLWLADVGQFNYEEINFVSGSEGGGQNFGWDCREGLHPYDDRNGDFNANCPVSADGFTDPIYEYTHANGNCSVTGGKLYRGHRSSQWRGAYFFADYCQKQLHALISSADETSAIAFDHAPYLGHPTAFGRDAAGELLLGTTSGVVYRLELPDSADDHRYYLPFLSHSR